MYRKKKFLSIVIALAIMLGNSLHLQAQKVSYVNDMDYVLGDVKQAFIQDKISTEAQVENLLLGFKAMGVNGIRIPIFAEGCTPNEEMLKYFYNRAMGEGYLIFANPAQHSGGQRIANGVIAEVGESVLDNDVKTNNLINRIIAFSEEYRVKWINPFNEDGKPGAAWSASQMNKIYSSLYGKMYGAELIGPCVWGIPASINVLNNTEIRNYITIATTHNLGFNHDDWPTFIASANESSLPVWDSEVNHNDKYGTGTRLEVAIANKVDGLVLYNSWNTISLTNGTINSTAETWMSHYIKEEEPEPVSAFSDRTEGYADMLIYPNPTSDNFTVANVNGSQLNVYDVLGKLVISDIIKSDAHKVNMDELSNGIYFVRIENNGVAINHKLVKK